MNPGKGGVGKMKSGRVLEKKGQAVRTPVTVTVFMTLGMLFLMCVSVCAAPVKSAGRPKEADGASIEVVGEISIDDEIIIEDGEVPLAMFEEEAPVQSRGRIAMMAAVLFATIGYAVYFDRYEEKLFRLRQEAARARVCALGRRED